MKTKLLKLFIAVVIFIIPTVNFAQAPNLGTLSNYVLFTSTGAVGNTGNSQVTGNVGTNIGAVTGFGNVNGVMNVANATTLKCTDDLTLLYTELSNTVATISFVDTIGVGDTLVEGVYSVPGASVLDLNLILDAKNNPNAIFIFKINGAFSTTANSKVELINGALACNVFWNVEGAIALETNSSMKGTLIANNNAVSMAVGTSLEGRLFSTTGAISVNGVYAHTPIGCGSLTLTGAVEPTLASTECFSIFSSDGLVSNTGTTNVLGDVGTNLGATNGYNSFGVTGIIHSIPDEATALCATNLNDVFTYLDTIPTDIELLYPALFGRNLVLTPHTYILNAATQLTDTLYFDAQGNTNSVFVIKINGAFTTSTFSKIILINEAIAKNIFWKIEGAVFINDSSDFKGTIVCNNADIILNSGVTINGRAFTTKGIITSTDVAVAMPHGCVLTNIDNKKSNELISIYPNPFTQSINVVSNSENSNLELKIYNVLGTEILNKKITNKETNINVNNLSSGIYIYNLIENNNVIQTGKIVAKQ